MSVVVVIPTRNRPGGVEALLARLATQSSPPRAVIVVDSSDDPTSVGRGWPFELVHETTDIRSAAVQRNIGLELALKGWRFAYMAFLDDDVIPPHDYLERLALLLDHHEDVTGASGVARTPGRPYQRPRGAAGVIQRMAGLASKRDGAVLPSGVNTGVVPDESCVTPLSAEWLIGCSVWRRRVVEQLRFERDFRGQSLAEDVVFSCRARGIGPLLVHPAVILEHHLNPIGRPSSRQHWAAWVQNRRRVIQVARNGNAVRYHIANIVMLGLLASHGVVRRSSASRQAARGVLDGMTSDARHQTRRTLGQDA